MVQTTYGNMPVASIGQIADINPATITSKVAEGTVLFGYPVVRGTADNQAKVPTATGQKFLGVAVRSLAAYASADDISKYADETVFSVIEDGFVWVSVDEAVVAGDPVYFIHTGNVGRFRTDANTDKADIVTGATFETSADANGLALIKLG